MHEQKYVKLALCLENSFFPTPNLKQFKKIFSPFKVISSGQYFLRQNEKSIPLFIENNQEIVEIIITSENFYLTMQQFSDILQNINSVLNTIIFTCYVKFNLSHVICQISLSNVLCQMPPVQCHVSNFPIQLSNVNCHHSSVMSC